MRANTFPRKSTAATLAAFAVAMTATVATAEDFGPVQYDAQDDQLIVTMKYDGTNPNHHFSFQWGQCRKVTDQLHEPAHQVIDVDIIDDDGSDAATTSYTEIVKIPLAGLSCRPATVTLWTAPNSSTSIDIP
jgi:hypothetical protein